jgi:hypothetical protein
MVQTNLSVIWASVARVTSNSKYEQSIIETERIQGESRCACICVPSLLELDTMCILSAAASAYRVLRKHRVHDRQRLHDGGRLASLRQNG